MYTVHLPKPWSRYPHRVTYRHNVAIHPTVQILFGMSNDMILERYKAHNPDVDLEALKKYFSYESKHLQWGATDVFPSIKLFETVDLNGERIKVVQKLAYVIENNTVPGVQHSIPIDDTDPERPSGFFPIMKNMFLYHIRDIDKSEGVLAIFVDMASEQSGIEYAEALAMISGEPVYLVKFKLGVESMVEIIDGRAYIKNNPTNIPIRAIFRYMTDEELPHIFINLKTRIINTYEASLAGGGNKNVAAIAYREFNEELKTRKIGVQIRTPKTFPNVPLDKIQEVYQMLGGCIVIKEPSFHSGKGIYPIICQTALDKFLQTDHESKTFLVQELIGHPDWNSNSDKLYHRGTVPDRWGRSYIYDMRFLCINTQYGYRPIALFARRASKPLTTKDDSSNLWDIIGTNMGSINSEGKLVLDQSRAMYSSMYEFDNYGLNLDDLIDVYVQSILTMLAIDQMALKLTRNGKFDKEMYKMMVNPNDLLLSKIEDPE